MENFEQDNNLEQAEVAVAPKRDWFLPASIVFAALLISASVLYATGVSKKAPVKVVNDQNQQQLSSVPEIGDRDVILGDPNAPVTLIEYGDYQCPYCAKFASEIEPLLRSDYIEKGKVKMVYRDFIVIDNFPGSKGESHAAAEAAECAKDQGKFWEYHDALYKLEEADAKENNGNLNRSAFMKIASDLKMDEKSFGSCIDSNKYSKNIQDQSTGGELAGVQGTPSVFINGQQVSVNPTYIKSLIDGLLKTQK